EAEVDRVGIGRIGDDGVYATGVAHVQRAAVRLVVGLGRADVEPVVVGSGLRGHGRIDHHLRSAATGHQRAVPRALTLGRVTHEALEAVRPQRLLLVAAGFTLAVLGVVVVVPLV